MSLDRFATSLEIKQVDQRVITGFAAAGGLDRVGDVIDMSTAFTKTLNDKRPSEVAVFIGHDTSALPVGIPIKIEATPDGLITETKVFDGPAGDNLLAVARGLRAAGQTLGLSIGYRVTDAQPDRVNGKAVRRLTGIDLIEYSFAARQSIANPRALVTGVKTNGGSMKVEQRGDKYHVVDANGDSMGSYDTEAAAKAAMAMHKDGGTAKTIDVAALPDSAFLHIQEGGQKDDTGRTVPRSLRHFPVRDEDGHLDAKSLAAVLAEIPEAKAVGLATDELVRLQTRVRRMVETIKRGDALSDEPAEWKTGVSVDLMTIAYRLIDAADQVVTEHKALGVIRESTKNGWRMRPEMQDAVKSASDALGRIVGQIDLVAQGKDEEALADWWRAQFEMLEVAS